MPKSSLIIKKRVRSSKRIALSLVVPAYRCTTIRSDIERIIKILDTLHIEYEIICVVDGLDSNKDKTLKYAQAIKSSKVKIIHYPINRGKGYAVRTGFSQARGQVIGFMDAGNDIAAESLAIAYELQQRTQADVIAGSKQSTYSQVNTPWHRHVFSTILHFFLQLFFQLPVRDTQAGLKLFQANVIKKSLPFLKIHRWAFDIELLIVVKKLGYTNIIESPVRLTYNYASTVTFSALFTFLWEFLQIFFRLHVLRSYDPPTKRTRK